jgi:hypothetical protein
MKGGLQVQIKKKNKDERGAGDLSVRNPAATFS